MSLIVPIEKKKKRYVSGMFCDQCDEYFKKNSKSNRKCDDCKRKNMKKRVERMKQQRKILNNQKKSLNLLLKNIENNKGDKT